MKVMNAIGINVCMLGNESSADFFQINLLEKSGILSECQNGLDVEQDRQITKVAID